MSEDGTIFSDEIADQVIAALKAPSNSYSSSQKEDYRRVRKLFADQYGLNVSDLTWRVNSLASAWKDDFGFWPTAQALFQWGVAQNSIGEYASGVSQLGPVFSVIGEDGTTSTFYNDPVRGLQAPDPQVGPIDYEFLATGTRAPKPQRVYNAAEIPNILAGLSPIKQPHAGGGGRGGAGRTPLAFDRRQLSEQALERWRGLLLEEADDTTIDKIVNDYINNANGFWTREGGRLDYDTFVVDRIRANDKYNVLYGKKPEFQTEAEYMGQYRQAVGQFGTNRTATLREVEAGASSGAGLAGFTERVGRTREVRVGDLGGFSRQLASSMQQMGRMG